MNRPITQFLFGAALGLVTSFALVAGVLGLVAAATVLVMLGIFLPRYAALSGGMVAVGLTWFTLTYNSVTICSSTDDFCGNANFAPYLVLSLGLIVGGVFFGILTLRSRLRVRRRSE